MPRFVILEHDFPQRHWDFMLEAGEVLRTWKLAACPRPQQPIAAVPSFDHRRLYLDYEGPISGGRGAVVRWDGGSFTWIVDAADEVTVFLEGTRMRGRVRLKQEAGSAWTWVLND